MIQDLALFEKWMQILQDVSRHPLSSVTIEEYRCYLSQHIDDSQFESVCKAFFEAGCDRFPSPVEFVKQAGICPQKELKMPSDLIKPAFTGSTLADAVLTVLLQSGESVTLTSLTRALYATNTREEFTRCKASLTPTMNRLVEKGWAIRVSPGVFRVSSDAITSQYKAMSTAIAAIVVWAWNGHIAPFFNAVRLPFGLVVGGTALVFALDGAWRFARHGKY